MTQRYLSWNDLRAMFEGSPEMLHVCEDCGAAVAKPEIHDVWHERMVAVNGISATEGA